MSSLADFYTCYTDATPEGDVNHGVQWSRDHTNKATFTAGYKTALTLFHSNTKIMCIVYELDMDMLHGFKVKIKQVTFGKCL